MVTVEPVSDLRHLLASASNDPGTAFEHVEIEGKIIRNSIREKSSIDSNSSSRKSIDGGPADQPQSADVVSKSKGACASGFTAFFEAIVGSHAFFGKERTQWDDHVLLAPFVSTLAGLGIPPAALAKTVSDSFAAIEKTAQELDLSDEERKEGLSNLITEAVRLMPQITTALLITALLPSLTARTLRQLQYGRGMARQDAEDLSQEIATKIVSALWGRQPRQNVGAWLAQIRTFANIDQFRKEDREKTALECLKEAAKNIYPY